MPTGGMSVFEGGKNQTIVAQNEAEHSWEESSISVFEDGFHINLNSMYSSKSGIGYRNDVLDH